MGKRDGSDVHPAVCSPREPEDVWMAHNHLWLRRLNIFYWFQETLPHIWHILSKQHCFEFKMVSAWYPSGGCWEWRERQFLLCVEKLCWVLACMNGFDCWSGTCMTSGRLSLLFFFRAVKRSRDFPMGNLWQRAGKNIVSLSWTVW